MTYTRNSRGRHSSKFTKSYTSQGNASRGGSFRPQFQNKPKRKQQIFNPIGLIEQKSEIQNEAQFVPTYTFETLPLADELKKNIINKGYSLPTPIQDQAIPAILKGQDIIGIANTGTGKTGAFLIPLLHKNIENKNFKVLIVAPTRELAVQIRDELYRFSKGLQVGSVLAIGGASAHRQRQELRRGPQFVIGTPGRIKDLIRDRSLNLSNFSAVVLDEADHMVDIGFIHDIKFIISFLPAQRQSLFFSATVDGKVEEIIATFVKNPQTISVKKQKIAANVDQEMIKVPNKEKKLEVLHDLLIKKEFVKVLIFGRTKWGVQRLSDELVKRGFKAAAIHGNKSQNQRQRALDQFKRNDIQILLATDVASRGLDIDNVSHVINYEMPSTHDEYIHRIGRTGRADKKGIALTFFE